MRGAIKYMPVSAITKLADIIRTIPREKHKLLDINKNDQDYRRYRFIARKRGKKRG